jgi:putative efflux protein, MATE family
MSLYIPTELGTEKISTLLKKYALPAIIAMAASSLYNIIDSIYIGQGVGAYAIAGLAISFPLMNLSAAFGTLVGVGAVTSISVSLGQKNYDTAQKVFGNAIILTLIIGIIYMAIMLSFLNPILYFFGASENTLPYAKDFMTIILSGNLITHMYFGLNAMQRASGFPKESMYATIITVINNIIFGALFILVFKWGIRGAAFATLLSQFISLCWVVKLYSNKGNIIHFQKGIYKLKKRLVTDILSVGAAPFLMNLAACMIVILINKGLFYSGGDMAIGAYGIINRVLFLFVMVVMGLNQGMQPIAGYNYGANNYERLMSVLKKTIVLATIVMSIGFIIGEFFPYYICRAFTTNEELIDISVKGMRICILCMPIVGVQMVTSNFFQSIRKPAIAIFLSLSRQLIVLLPCLLILPYIYGVNGVWFSLPISDLISCIISILMLMYQIKKIKKSML